MNEFEELERKNKGGRPKKIEPVVENVVEKAEEVDVALLVSENEKLKAENEQFRNHFDTTMAEFQKKLDAMSGKPAEVNTGDTLDQSRPFSKTRNITGGLFYEQDGKQFDGAMRLKK